MIMRRKSTLAFARKHIAPKFPEIAKALNLPMVAPILDAIDRTEAARFIVMAPAQVFKTLVLQLRAVRCMKVEPSNSLWYAHPEKFLDDFADEKFNPLFDAIDVLQPMLFQRPNGSLDPSKRARTRLQFPGWNFLLLSARVQNNRQGKTARDVYIDEPWTYEKGWLEEISKRRSSFDDDQNWREIYASTGSEIGGEDTPGSDFSLLWESSDKRVWHCRCPGCGGLFEPRRTHRDPKTQERSGGLVYKTTMLADGSPDVQAIADSVRYQCPLCAALFEDTLTSRTALNRGGEFRITNPNASTAPITIGWNVNACALKSWAELAVRMVVADMARQRGDLEPTKNLVMQSDAGIWDPMIYLREAKERPVGGYKMLQDWDREHFEEKEGQFDGKPSKVRLYSRSAFVDVQQDHFVVVVRKWARDSQSRLHYAEKIVTPEIVKERLDMCGVRPSWTFLDCRHVPERVRQLCGLYGWRAILGEPEKSYLHPSTGLRRIYSTPKPLDPWIGTPQQGRVLIWEFNFSKPSALERLSLLRTVPRNDGELHWSAADDAPEWYFKEIEAYHRVRKTGPKGDTYYEWQVHGPDHGADCEAGNVVIASMADLAGAESIGAKP